ncbi:hypothetical protein QZH41_019575 [Actinostola sp. cb2023]|nr:hypothetical protein QZH41_019575 [Actinostola sp. cb2023]
MNRNDIRHIRSAPYHPATNGLAERFVQSLKRALRHSEVDENKEENTESTDNDDLKIQNSSDEKQKEMLEDEEVATDAGQRKEEDDEEEATDAGQRKEEDDEEEATDTGQLKEEDEEEEVDVKKRPEPGD